MRKDNFDFDDNTVSHKAKVMEYDQIYARASNYYKHLPDGYEKRQKIFDRVRRKIRSM